MIENSQQIFRELLHQQKFDEIITLINSGKIDLLNLYLDDKKQTLLHYMVTIQKVNLLLFLQKYCFSNYNSEEIKKWVNKLNADQFAAIHLASFSGNLQCLDILISLGANHNLRSGSGLLPIHAAAQGDQPFVIKYWIENGIDINILDNIGNSCLHWAVYQGCDISVNYLISFGCQLNIQNQQHQTPLHIGVKYGQTRIVKKLLIRGADRYLQDNDHKTALQLAKESELNFIANMLEDSSEIAIFCSIGQSYHPTQRRTSQIVAFLCIYLSTNIFINFITFEQCKIQFSISLIFEIGTILLYFLVVFTTPGYVRQQIQLTPIMNVKGNPEQICPDCQVIRPPRSKHCEICKKCVIVYDHHCPWVNNCIGARNFVYFFNFLSLFLVQIMYVIYIIVYTLIYSKHLLLLIYPIIIILIFSVPILYKMIQLYLLWYIYLKNILDGISTYERNSNQNKKRSFILPDEQDVSTDNGSLLRDTRLSRKRWQDNCLDMCFRNEEYYNQYIKL